MLIIQNNTIVREHEGQILWTMAVDKLKLIGEYTTAAGPMVDDWFFVFAETVEFDKLRLATALEIEHTQFWGQLRACLDCGADCKMAPHLFASTSWASRVMYPEKLAGQELFKLVKLESVTKNFWRRLFGNDADERIELTQEVQQFFA